MHTVAALAQSSDNPFFLITGLPVHTLVVHFAVSMLPLSAIALCAIVLVPRWRGAFVWAAMVGLVIGTGAAFVSMLSGQALADVIGVPSKHSKWGDILPWVGLALLIVALIWWYLWRKSAKPEPLPKISMGSGGLMITGIIAILLSIVTFGLTVLVGHTGAEAVWVTRSLDSEAAEDAVTPQPSGSAAATGGLDLSVVAQHSSPSDCWSVVTSNVYDLTAWIPQHPGGSGVVENMCGRDGTKAYNGQHQGDAAADAILAGFLVGPLGGPLPGSSAAASAAPSAPASSAASAAASSAAPASSAAAAGAITAADVAKHATATDCWSSIDANVYDLTSWVDAHPGGPDVIVAMCGTDGTAMYNSVHEGQAEPKQILDTFLVGPLS